MTTPALLLCTDMDRTLLPNGAAAESPLAIPLLKQLLTSADIKLAYVTGRDRNLVSEAITSYGLPYPDYVIGDVGTSIYSVDENRWQHWESWQAEIQYSWRGLVHDELHSCLRHVDGLQLQEEEKQNRYKLSYYAPAAMDTSLLLAEIRERLSRLDIDCNIIWSVDETCDQGLLDILPAAASKYHAVDFLMRQLGCTLDNTLFAGDSGNDIDVLCSPIRAVLVANASSEVRRQAINLAIRRGHRNALYLATGGYLGMNGNYAAGILEGMVHYYPELIHSIEYDDST